MWYETKIQLLDHYIPNVITVYPSLLTKLIKLHQILIINKKSFSKTTEMANYDQQFAYEFSDQPQNFGKQ